MSRTAEPKENYAEAAARHLDAADCLCKHEHHDAAVYLSGFAVECMLKFWLSRAVQNEEAIVSHALDRLSGDDLAWTSAVVPSSSLARWLGQLKNHTITRGHPRRRYWADRHWERSEADECVWLARDLFDAAILGPMFDHHVTSR